jgi:hypothetical protein
MSKEAESQSAGLSTLGLKGNTVIKATMPLEFRVTGGGNTAGTVLLGKAQPLNKEEDAARPAGDAAESQVRRFGASSIASKTSASPMAELMYMVEHPERPRARHRPPFCWSISPDYAPEFQVSGRHNEVVTKVGDFRERDFVIPAGGSLQLMKGACYRWTLHIERICSHQPQMQLGIHGSGHRRPWRLLATSRCSRARDDEPWSDRPDGDRPIEEGDFVHLEVDLCGLHLPFGTMSLSINNDPPEVVFDDIPLNTGVPFMPVVSMGGGQSRVRICPAF